MSWAELCWKFGVRLIKDLEEKFPDSSMELYWAPGQLEANMSNTVIWKTGGETRRISIDMDEFIADYDRAFVRLAQTIWEMN